MGFRRDLAPFASEFVGTFFLVLTISLNVLQNHPWGPIAIGFMLTALIFTSGSVSGGHFNPAVTVGVRLSGRGLVSDGQMILLIAAQLCGALFACLMSWVILGATFALQPGEGHSWLEAGIAEVTYSTGLILVVLNTATLLEDSKHPFRDDYAGLAIGLAVVAAAFSVGAISGCSLNPALVFGAFTVRAFEVGVPHWSLPLVYFLSPLVGAVIASFVFLALRPAEYWNEFAEPKIRGDRSATLPRHNRVD
jgi:aquaporin Z|eukprot:TRINITY_DN4953_c0_g1_i1.p1 TRINITY_DN4953_c0_g1~~TRINITY_DN4953_c0_g1_i1.p1  ORF type:complete len:250 (-),score=42.43 TRINITY_DN4953_c0_g1_i1:155-904(-)